MPELGRYAKLPRPESFMFFENRVRSLSVCKKISKEDTQIYRISRYEKSDIVVFLTNIYIVGEADVYEIITEFPEVNTIVTISNWNSYSNGAKEYAKENGVALFKMPEFQRAIKYDGKRYINY